MTEWLPSVRSDHRSGPVRCGVPIAGGGGSRYRAKRSFQNTPNGVKNSPQQRHKAARPSPIDLIVKLPTNLNERVVLARIGFKHFTPLFNCLSKVFCPFCFIKTGCEGIEHLVEFLRPLGHGQKPKTSRQANSVVKIDERKLLVTELRSV